MRVIVIGGSGHIGTYLIPRLVENGYEVLSIARGKSNPYKMNGMWKWVQPIIMDREEEETKNTYGKKLAALKPDIVVDLLTYHPENLANIVNALDGIIQQYVFCSSIWAHGAASVVPAPEELPRHPFGAYGIGKAACEAYLHEVYRKRRFPETVIMPGHITGPGWNFINPCGNLDPMVFQRIGRGETIYLPNFGMETLHNVHADDVAQVFMNAILYSNRALGESFHAAAPAATTMRGIAEKMFMWFGQEPNIECLPWKEWCEKTADKGFIASTENHVRHSDNYSIAKAKALLNYQPRYTIFQAMCEGVESMIARGIISV
ncbi:MAG: NAD-dependent epimerase/dehydratase family protein [Clostridiales bacterium]|nr:NAD-dependent epimerase/dehydratase family protein [Clostridiales bacterium]MDY4007719.1 NAD-dependent epimerase/dehydratase family protein [Candidatus Limiplasma sp.]